MSARDELVEIGTAGSPNTANQVMKEFQELQIMDWTANRGLLDLRDWNFSPADLIRICAKKGCP
jgi:hypothetical protein